MDGLQTQLEPLGGSFTFDALAVTLIDEAHLSPREACAWLREARVSGRLVRDPQRPGQLTLEQRPRLRALRAA